MKNYIYPLLLLIVSSLFVFSCSEDDNGGSDMTPSEDIVGVAISNNYTSLAAALTAADLVDDLKADGPLTVFAPTDAAFAQLLSDLGLSGLDEIAKEDLIEKISVATRRLAKSQKTFFRKIKPKVQIDPFDNQQKISDILKPFFLGI